MGFKTHLITNVMENFHKTYFYSWHVSNQLSIDKSLCTGLKAQILSETKTENTLEEISFTELNLAQVTCWPGRDADGDFLPALRQTL